MAATLDTSSRRELYLLVARLLGEELDSALYRRLLATQSDALPWIEPEIAELPEPLALEALATEYCRLFIGPDLACSPYASVVRGEALLGGRARASVDDFLTARGLALAAHARLATPDHVAVVFAVLAELSDPDDIASWLRHHVLPWVPRWLSALDGEARCLLFRTLARLGAAVIADDEARYPSDSQALVSEA